MALRSRHGNGTVTGGEASHRRWVVLPGVVVLAAAIMLLAGRGPADPPSHPSKATPPAASPRPLDGPTRDRVPFARAVVQAIEQRGRISVTVHVALADHRVSDVPAKFGDGRNPAANLYWGALFGVETHLANAAGWRRAYTDDGDGRRIIRRVVFHRRADPTPAWRSRGVTRPFDLYLLACAWPSSQTAAAMEQPLRDALTDEPTVLTIGNTDIGFGAGSVMTGFLGPNRMLQQYWDPFAGLPPTAGPRQMGVFYLCSRSAVVLHTAVVGHGLYSVLFARESIVPEAYLLDGLIQALLKGELDGGFLTAAADQYARHQKGVSPDVARFLFYR